MSKEQAAEVLMAVVMVAFAYQIYEISQGVKYHQACEFAATWGGKLERYNKTIATPGGACVVEDYRVLLPNGGYAFPNER